MSRYRLSETGVAHDSQTRCDDAQREGLAHGGYLALQQWIRAGSELCDHCFRSDAAEEDISEGAGVLSAPDAEAAPEPELKEGE